MILRDIEHPFIVHLNLYADTHSVIMIGIEFCSRGDIFTYLANGGRFNEEAARFYIAELVLAIEYIHNKV